MFHVNIEEYGGGSRGEGGGAGGAKTAIPQGKKSKYRTVLSRKNPNAIQVILCPARLEPQYCNLIIKLQKDCFKISGSVTDIKEV